MTKLLARQRKRVNLPTWPNDFLMRLCLERLNLSPLQTLLLVFPLYWGIPAIANALQGTLLTVKPTASSTIAVVNVTPYLLDRSQLLFSLAVVVGCGLGNTLLRQLQTLTPRLVANHVIVTPEQTLDAFYARHRALGNHVLAKWGAFVITLVASFGGWRLIYGSTATERWGHPSNGRASVVLFVIATFTVYQGSRGFALLIAGSLMASRVLRGGVRLQPHHADGCNGLAPLGQLIMSLWGFALACALAIYIVLYSGYYGLEREWPTWCVAVVFTALMPILALYPLLGAVRALKHEQARVLEMLEALIRPRWEEGLAEFAQGTFPDAKAEADMELIMRWQDAVRNMNVWPFNPRAIAFISVAYGIQVVLTVQQLIDIVTGV